VTERRTVEIRTPALGWEYPWPNAFEIAAVFPTEHWGSAPMIRQRD
jgi:hypothetical protein